MSEQKTKVERLIEESEEEVSGYLISRYNSIVLGEFVGFYSGRNRGSWVDVDSDGAVIITFCGRVGGGNREDWEDVWDSAYEHDWLVSAMDDEGDSTYANFVFAVPAERVNELWTLTPRPTD